MTLRQAARVLGCFAPMATWLVLWGLAFAAAAADCAFQHAAERHGR